MIQILQYLSIAIEIIIAIFGLLIAKKKVYGWFIFLTFIIYVLYDFAKQTSIIVSSAALYVLFFIASLSAWYAVWLIYKETKKHK